MEGLAALVICCTAILPIVWIFSEFSDKRWLRVTVGVAAMVSSFLIAYSVGTTARTFEANAWFGSATKTLVDTTVRELKSGQTERVVASLEQLQEQYRPSYETRARYDELVIQAVERMTPTTSPAPR